MKTEQSITETLTALGFTLLLTGGARGEVRDNDWLCIAYSVRLEYKGRSVIETDYCLGVGHVKPKGARFTSWALTTDESRLLKHWQSNPGAQFSNKQTWADVAAKLAKAQKVVPQLADVMHSLMMDGEAFFDATTFEDWAANLGYDADSRKAETIYKACDDIGRKLARGIPSEVLAQVREIVSEL
jgi:hypothetical protein